MNRRTFVQSLAAVAGATSVGLPKISQPAEPRLKSRARNKVAGTLSNGRIQLGLEQSRDGFLFLPARYDPTRAIPLMVLLHGAGGSAQNWGVNWTLRSQAYGIALLAIDSRGTTWDIIRGDFGADVAFIDRALEWVFARVLVDTKHVALAGFSDGASYALSVGLPNGDLFSHVIAFSPGFEVSTRDHGHPKVYISHGTSDDILPIDATSRRLVPQLRARDVDLTYREFDGRHQIPAEIGEAACTWFVGPPMK